MSSSRSLVASPPLGLPIAQMRSVFKPEEVERRLAKPVICSNQAMLWDCLRLAGVDDRLPGLGSLFRDR